MNQTFTQQVQTAIASVSCDLLAIYQREATEWPNLCSEGDLARHVELVNSAPINADYREPCMFVDALRAFDIEALSAMIHKGVNVAQWYSDAWGLNEQDPIAQVVDSYRDRAVIFGTDYAAQAWANRCAECIALLVSAGASTVVHTFIGPEFEPVKLNPYMQGFGGLKGWETIGHHSVGQPDIAIAA